jgi:hypothetical protein
VVIIIIIHYYHCHIHYNLSTGQVIWLVAKIQHLYSHMAVMLIQLLPFMSILTFLFYITNILFQGLGGSVSIGTRLWSGQKQRIFHPSSAPSWLWAHPAPVQWVLGAPFPWVTRSQGMLLTADPLLMPRLRKKDAIPPLLPKMPSGK